MGSQKQRSLIRCPFLPGAQLVCSTQKAIMLLLRHSRSHVSDHSHFLSSFIYPEVFIEPFICARPSAAPQGCRTRNILVFASPGSTPVTPTILQPEFQQLSIHLRSLHGLSFLPRMPFPLLCLPNPDFSFNNLSVRFFTYSIKQSKSVSTLVL